MSDHMPACRLYRIDGLEHIEARTAYHPDDPGIPADGIYAEKCADGCPIGEARLERVRQIAREKGWMRDDGSFVWSSASGW